MNKWNLLCPACNSGDHLLLGSIQWLRATKTGFTQVGSAVVMPNTKIKCEKCGYVGFYNELKESKDEQTK